MTLPPVSKPWRPYMKRRDPVPPDLPPAPLITPALPSAWLIGRYATTLEPQPDQHAKGLYLWATVITHVLDVVATLDLSPWTSDKVLAKDAIMKAVSALKEKKAK